MNYKATAIKCIQDESQALLELIPNINDDFNKAVEIILNCKGKLIVTGVGKSGHIGAKIAATLSSTGTPSFFINPLDAFHGDLGVIQQNDVILALSNSGQTDELLRFMPYMMEHNIPVIGMSGNPDSLLAKYATAHLNSAVSREACPLGLAPTSSTTAALALGDALACALMVATVNGQVAGIITDGDIRRAMESSQDKFFQLKMEDIMTRTPKMVSPETKVTEIEDIMHRNKIHCVLVVDEEKHLLGVVDSFRTMI